MEISILINNSRFLGRHFFRKVFGEDFLNETYGAGLSRCQSGILNEVKLTLWRIWIKRI